MRLLAFSSSTIPSYAATPSALLLRCTLVLVLLAGGAIQSRAATITATPPIQEVTVVRGEAAWVPGGTQQETIVNGVLLVGMDGYYPNRNFRRAALVFDVSALSGIDPQDIVSISLTVWVQEGPVGSRLEAIPLAGPEPGWANPFQVTTVQPQPGTPCETDPESCPAIFLGGSGLQGEFGWTTVDVTGAVAALGEDFLQISFVPTQSLGVAKLFGEAASLTFEVVPEPSTSLLLATGLAGLAASQRRRQ